LVLDCSSSFLTPRFTLPLVDLSSVSPYPLAAPTLVDHTTLLMNLTSTLAKMSEISTALTGKVLDGYIVQLQ
jgi:hypothetical protein